MTLKETFTDGGRRYTIKFKPELSGRLVYGVRVYPYEENLASPFDVYAIRWAVNL